MNHSSSMAIRYKSVEADQHETVVALSPGLSPQAFVAFHTESRAGTINRLWIIKLIIGSRI